jgi:hypothetical protein
MFLKDHLKNTEHRKEKNEIFCDRFKMHEGKPEKRSDKFELNCFQTKMKIQSEEVSSRVKTSILLFF